MSVLSRSPSARSSALQKGSGRILFAVSDMDLERFFPGGIAALFPPGRLLRVKPEERRADFSPCADASPEVLVSAWSTPPLDDALLHGPLSSVRYVCHLSGSVRAFVPRTFIERGGKVTNWGGLAAEAVAEHALLLTLAGLRRLPLWREKFTPGTWWGLGVVKTETLFRRKVGVHGAGGVACALAKLLRPFGVEVEAYSEGVPDEVYRASGLKKAATLETLFMESDIVIECEALIEATRGCVSRAILTRMRPGALFVNVGRAAVVDNRALAEMARMGRIRVALDVFDCEPPASDFPFWHVPDAVLSPHIAGPTVDQLTQMGELALANIERYFLGVPLEAEVSLDIYDRST